MNESTKVGRRSGLSRIVIYILITTFVSCAIAEDKSQTQIERYYTNSQGNTVVSKTYKIAVPGENPITIVEESPSDIGKWVDVSTQTKRVSVPADRASNFSDQVTEATKHDELSADLPSGRCYGPSCRDEMNFAGNLQNLISPEQFQELLIEYADKLQGADASTKEKLQAISALASKLTKNKATTVRYDPQRRPALHIDDDEGDNMDKSYTTAWNRLKLKKNKHPYDDKKGWVTLEAVPWSTSKISKWKPNPNKYNQPNPGSYEENPYEIDRFSQSGYYDSEAENNNNHNRPFKRPSYINNKPNFESTLNSDWSSDLPSRPTWNKNHQNNNLASSWSSDESRKPYKPSCDHDSDSYPLEEPSVYYGMGDSVIDSQPTLHRPATYEYEPMKRPFRRPTQVVYSDLDNEEQQSQHPSSHPSSGHGQWVLLSTTKGYQHSKNKRQRSLNISPPSLSSHQAVQLTVLPPDNSKPNMTTSHGGLLEVERSFKTVEEAKFDIDNNNKTNNSKPQKVSKKRLVSQVTSNPDSSAVLAAVGAGMLPATMAMVVPMMLGRRRRRRATSSTVSLQNQAVKNAYQYGVILP